MHALINADSSFIPLADNSVSMVVTSPPYYNLRQYEGTLAWEGGDKTCDHVANPNATKIFGNPDFNLHRPSRGKIKMADYYAPVCPKCGAVRVDNQIGNEQTPQGYVDNIVAIFREIKRVLHPTGTAWLNLGDSHWGSGGAHKTQHGNPGISRSAFRDGKTRDSKAISVDGLKPKDLIGIPWRVALALQEDGWWLRSDIIWSKGNPMPESVEDRPTRSHEYIFLLSKSRKYAYDWYAIREPLAESTEDRNAYPHNGEKTLEGIFSVSRARNAGEYGYTDGRNKRTVWDINTQPYPGSHYAVFPEELAEMCIKAGASEMGRCPKCGRQWRRLLQHKEERPSNEERIARLGEYGIDRHSANLYAQHEPNPVRMVGWAPSCKCGLDPMPCLVLDPFAGSGTTLLVARRLGRHAIGLDLSMQYLIENARTRLSFDKLDEWQNGRRVEANIDDLPLFGGGNG